VALLGVIASWDRSLPRAAVAAGWQTRQAFLLEHEPSYAASLAANRMLKPGDRILSQDYRTFYFDAPVTREAVFRRETHYDRSIERPTELAGFLRSSGFTHVLLAEAAGPGIRYNSRLLKLVEAARAEDASAWLKLADYEFHDADGALRRYRLIAVR
jgi:hypothetical protein